MKVDRNLLWAGLFVLLWSTGFVGIRYGAPYSPPFLFIAVRMAIAAFLLALGVLILEKRFTLSLQEIGKTSISGFLLHGAYLGGCFYAVSEGIPAGVVALIVSLQPIFVAIASTLIFNENVSLRNIIGLFLGTSGVLLVIIPRLSPGSSTSLSAAGVIACLIAMLGGASGTLAQKSFGQSANPLESAMYQYITTGALLYLLSRTFSERSIIWSGQFIASLAWLVLVLSIGAILILFALLKKGSASSVSSLYYLVPPTTALMSHFLFGESLTFALLIGMLITVSGVYLVVKSPQK